MTEHLNRPMFRVINRKLNVIQAWCQANGVDPSKIIAVQLHPVYGFGQGTTKYAVRWDE